MSGNFCAGGRNLAQIFPDGMEWMGMAVGMGNVWPAVGRPAFLFGGHGRSAFLFGGHGRSVFLFGGYGNAGGGAGDGENCCKGRGSVAVSGIWAAFCLPCRGGRGRMGGFLAAFRAALRQCGFGWRASPCVCGGKCCWVCACFTAINICGVFALQQGRELGRCSKTAG